jgi:very-short-patch-repair endonuclease
MGEGWDGGMNRTKAKELRKNMTDSVRTLWRHLCLRQFAGYKVRRQQPIGKYIVDFACFERKLIIELDGSQHCEEVAYDLERSAWLEEQGFRILRFWDNEVFNETDGVEEMIAGALYEPFYTPHLNPPPQETVSQ